MYLIFAISSYVDVVTHALMISNVAAAIVSDLNNLLEYTFKNIFSLYHQIYITITRGEIFWYTATGAKPVFGSKMYDIEDVVFTV